MPEIRDLISQRNLCGSIPALTSVIGLILPCAGVHDGYRSMGPVKRILLYGYQPMNTAHGVISGIKPLYRKCNCQHASIISDRKEVYEQTIQELDPDFINCCHGVPERLCGSACIRR